MTEVAFHQDGDKLRVSIDGKMASEWQVNLVCEDLNDPVMAAVITARWQSRLDQIAKDLEKSGFGDWTK